MGEKLWITMVTMDHYGLLYGSLWITMDCYGSLYGSLEWHVNGNVNGNSVAITGTVGFLVDHHLPRIHWESPGWFGETLTLFSFILNPFLEWL
jgi:hypothetical protein